MFAWSKGLLLTTSLIGSFSNFHPTKFLEFVKEQNSSTSWLMKGVIATGMVAFAYQWYQVQNLKRKVDKVRYENMYFKDMLCLIIFGIEDYPLIRRKYWPNNYSVQASRIRIRNILRESEKYDTGDSVNPMNTILNDNPEFLDHEIESP